MSWHARIKLMDVTLDSATTAFIAYSAIVLVLLGTVYLGWLLFLIGEHGRVSRTELRINDGTVTKEEFIRLLDQARDVMIVHDDGDKVADSIYDNREIIEKVRKKLDESTNFKIRCLFNYDNPDLLFRKAALDLPRIEIKVRKSDSGHVENGLRSHYKVIDDGSQAYLSWHHTGSPERFYRTVDCSKVLRPVRKRVVQRALGGVLRHFALEYEKAEAVA